MESAIPIVVLISSYREGTLIQGAVDSVLQIATDILIYEGAVTEGSVIGVPTKLDYATQQLVYFRTGKWEKESEKRTEMVLEAKKKQPGGCWILTLDADEIVVWPEHLPALLNQLSPGYPKSPENIPSLKLTENIWVSNDNQYPFDNENPNSGEYRSIGFWTDYAPSHLFHSSLIERYTVGGWRFLTPDGKEGILDRRPAPNMPCFGEPHIHHRPYLRIGERKELRLSNEEELEWLTQRGLKKK